MLLYVHLRVDQGQALVDFPVALGDELLMITKGFERLAQSEQVLTTIVASQRLDNRFFRWADAFITQLRQHRRTPLPGEDAVDNRRARLTGDITDHVMQTQIHLVESFVHMLHVRGCGLYEALAVSNNGAHGADHLRRPERRTQESY